MHSLKQLILGLVIVLSSLGVITKVHADEYAKHAQASKYIYLIRHAEKQLDVKDPSLTVCGVQRAQSIAKQLELIAIDNVFSTNYQRTLQTAKPVAQSKNVVIKHYNPKELEAFAIELKQLPGNSVIVGHSNTTAVLAGLLTNIELTSFDESIYDRLYQVVIIGGNAQLQILQQNFNCSQ
ncbi:phosphoglycerate mutase family protein [Colwelliaceae bacterium BS250]